MAMSFERFIAVLAWLEQHRKFNGMQSTWMLESYPDGKQLAALTIEIIMN